MNVVFTICSINYLAQAKTLGDSLLQHNPNVKFVIAVVDRIDHRIDLSNYKTFRIIEIEDVGIPNMEEMIIRYDIVELNTAVKPFVVEYLFRSDKNIGSIIYLDPDIMVFDEFTYLFNQFQKYDILLTPHITSPVPTEVDLPEEMFLKHGIYNLGFIGIKCSQGAFAFIEWWKNRLRKRCLKDATGRYYVDQKWVNLAPIFFDKVGILKHQGLNMAYWNIYERVISKDQDRYRVNGKYPLLFFHFSQYNISNPNIISALQYGSISLDDRTDLKPLFDKYREALIDNNYHELSRVVCYYVSLRDRIRPRLSVGQWLVVYPVKLIKSIIPDHIKMMWWRYMDHLYRR